MFNMMLHGSFDNKFILLVAFVFSESGSLNPKLRTFFSEKFNVIVKWVPLTSSSVITKKFPLY